MSASIKASPGGAQPGTLRTIWGATSTAVLVSQSSMCPAVEVAPQIVLQPHRPCRATSRGGDAAPGGATSDRHDGLGMRGQTVDPDRHGQRPAVLVHPQPREAARTGL